MKLLSNEESSSNVPQSPSSSECEHMSESEGLLDGTLENKKLAVFLPPAIKF